jgi:hypothetical protein
MNHPLQQRINAVGRSARRNAVLYGVCWATVVIVASMLVGGLLDYYLRIEYRPARLLISAGLLIATGWGVYRFLYPQLMGRAGNVAVAQRVQDRYPQLNHKLASAVEFLGQSEDDALAGSPALRRAVVAQASAEVEQLELREVVSRRPAVKAVGGAAIVAAIATLVVLVSPANSRTALARLVNPLGDNAWPKRNQLAFVDPPSRVASGSLFEVELRDANNRMPEDVAIVYRFEEEDGPREVPEQMQFVDGVMVATRDNVRRPFAFRAVGGDDATPWHTLEVLEPPRIESLTATLSPPEYSGWPETTSSGRIAALAGTNVTLQASVSKPLESAALVTNDGKKIPAALSDDGLHLTIPASHQSVWMIRNSGTYTIELIDHDRITGGASDQWQIRAIADEAPTVNVEKPAAELHVTASAIVPLRVLAKDRLAIKDIAIKYIRSDASDEGEKSFFLFQDSEQVAPLTVEQLTTVMSEGDRELVVQDWELAAMKLEPGTQISFHASARDYQPAEGKSPVQRIIVLTEREILERLERRQVAILGDLSRIVERQKDARARTTDLEIQLDEVGQLEDQDIPMLQGLSLAQRDIRHSLTNTREGVRSQIRSVLDELQNNKLDSPEMTRRLSGLDKLIGQLEKDNLAPIESELTTAEKSVDRPTTSSKDAADEERPAKPTPEQQQRNKEALKSLTKAGQLQDGAIRSLEEALGDLQRWDNYRKFARELAGIQSGQQKLEQDTKAIGDQTLSRDEKDLSPQQRADLKKIAERQSELARRFDKITEGMEKAATKLADSDPLAADAIADARHQAGKKAISSRMRAASHNVSRNQVGQATDRQKQIGEDLQEMLDTLANRREQELERLVKKLREAENELRAKREEQAGLRKKMKDAEKIKNEEQRKRELQRLAKRQQQLKEDIDRMTRRLRRLQANRAASKLADASSQMEQAGQSGENGQGQQGGEQAEKAEKDLEEAQRRLAQARRQAEADLAEEKLARMQDQLKALVGRQQGVIDETQRLEAIRQEQERLTRGQKMSVSQLSEQQNMLSNETRQMAEKLAGAEVFRRALDGAAERMQTASERLSQRDTGEQTQRIERQAMARIGLIVKSLQPDKQGKKEGNGGGSGGASKPKGNATIRSLAELKLVKLLQDDLNLRTEENRMAITERAAREESVDELIAERRQLADEQAQLKEVVLEMLQSLDEAPEADPDNLPDLESLNLEDSEPASEPDITEVNEGKP